MNIHRLAYDTIQPYAQCAPRLKCRIQSVKYIRYSACAICFQEGQTHNFDIIIAVWPCAKRTRKLNVIESAEKLAYVLAWLDILKNIRILRALPNRNPS